MEQYVIKGGNPLVGEVSIAGAKNAALGILAAAIMTDEEVIIDNVPNVRDTRVLLQAIQGIGARVKYIDEHTVKICGGTINPHADNCVDERECEKRVFNLSSAGVQPTRLHYYSKINLHSTEVRYGKIIE